MEGLELQPCLELDRFMVVSCLVIKLATKMTDRGNSVRLTVFIIDIILILRPLKSPLDSQL